jgi:radical SAM superfamily enzyme YgiQ (UPF0313 family)
MVFQGWRNQVVDKSDGNPRPSEMELCSALDRANPRLHLVCPATHKLGWVDNFRIPPHSLQQVAAVPPPPLETTPADELHVRIPFNSASDLSGIATMTYQPGGAYEIADQVRREGMPVFIGGIHPGVLPEKALSQADAVVIGEAGPVMRKLPADFLARKRYLTTQTVQANRMKRIRGARIILEASMIFGFDDRDESIYEKTLRFIEDCAPSVPMFHILNTYPGAALYSQIEQKRRLLRKEWKRCNHPEVLSRPKLMTPARLYRGWPDVRAKKPIPDRLSSPGRKRIPGCDFFTTSCARGSHEHSAITSPSWQ